MGTTEHLQGPGDLLPCAFLLVSLGECLQYLPSAPLICGLPLMQGCSPVRGAAGEASCNAQHSSSGGNHGCFHGSQAQGGSGICTNRPTSEDQAAMGRQQTQCQPLISQTRPLHHKHVCTLTACNKQLVQNSTSCLCSKTNTVK